MKILAFDGGLSTRLDPHLIQKHEAQELVNVNTDKASLTPIKDKTFFVSGTAQYAYFSTIDDTWYYDSSQTDYVEFKNVLYKTDRTGAPQKIISGTSYDLGIPAPTGTVTLTAEDGPAPPAYTRIRPDFVVLGGSLPSNSTQYYKVTRTIVESGVPSIESVAFEAYPTLTSTSKPSPWRNEDNTILSGGEDEQVKAGLEYVNALSYTLAATQNSVTFRNPWLPNPTAGYYEVAKMYRWTQAGWILAAQQSDPAILSEDDGSQTPPYTFLDESGRVNGEVGYVITYYDSIRGVESAPLFVDSIAVRYGSVELTTIPVSSHPLVDKKRIYRVGGGLTAYSLVATIDNATTSYTDTTDALDVSSTTLTSSDNDTPPTGLKYLKEAYAMLFGAEGSKLRFTKVGQPDAWPEEYFIDFPEDITGISKTSVGLLVHTYYVTYLVTGTGPTSFVRQTLSEDQGCISHDSVQEHKDTAIWVSTDGICMSNGSDVTVVTEDRLGKQSFSVVNSSLLDEVYRLHLSDDKTFVFDLKRKNFKYAEYGIKSLVVANDTAYGLDSINDVYTLEAATTNLSLTYKSPEMIGPSFTEQKTFTDFRFYLSEGSTTVTVYIDNVEAVSYTTSTTGIHKPKIPKGFQRGSSLTFKVVGTGIVKEVVWEEVSANG